MPDSLAELKQKYQPAFDAMQQQQVSVSEVRMEGGKMYVLAQAPSQEAKNRVWDRIKEIDPGYDDLIADIRIGGQQQSDLHSEFDRLSASAPKSSLAGGLAEAFKSDQTPSFGQMVSHLFSHSDGQQRAGLLNQLLTSGPSGLAGELAGMLRGGNQVTPEQAQQVSPEAVQQLADGAQQHDPSIIDKISEYYSEHPTLVKTLGIGTLGVAVSKITGMLRGRSGGAS